MNILYLPYEFPPFFVGGLGTYAFEMARRFAKMGNSVTVFSKNPGDAITRDLYEGVEVHRPLLANVTDLLPLMVPEEVKRWPLRAQKDFAEVLMYNILAATKTINLLVRSDKRDFNIVVAHDWMSAMAGIVCKKSLNKPLVFHLHSTEHGRTGDGSTTIKNAERLAGKEAEAVITCSYAMRDELISLGYEEKKIHVVWNGVDHLKYNPSKFGEDTVRAFRKKLGVGNAPMMLFVGRLAAVKGVDTLVRAMPMILESVPKAKLVILGAGEQEEMIAHMVNSLGIQDNVILNFKYVDEKKRLLYYAASDIVVVPSKYEPFGIVCTEAMSMGKPVIVGGTGISGLREQVVSSGPSRCGAHINPYDPYDLAKFAVRFLEDENLRKELGGNARKRVIEKFTLDRVATETIDIYKRVAGIGEH